MTIDDEGSVIFYGAPGPPGAETGDPVEDALRRAHEAEVDKQGAKFGDYYWGAAENEICSKTTRGKLASRIDPETMKVSHSWLK